MPPGASTFLRSAAAPAIMRCRRIACVLLTIEVQVHPFSPQRAR